MKYSIGIAFLTISFLYSIVLNALFFSKKHINNLETKLFGIILPSNLVGLSLELLCNLSIGFFGVTSLVSIIVNKFFLIYIMLFATFLTLYVVIVCISNDSPEMVSSYQKKMIYGIVATFLLFLIVDFFLPIDLNYFEETGVMYSSGIAVNVVYIFSALSILYGMYIFITNAKNIRKKQNIPLVAYVVGSAILAFVQQRNPGFTIATSIETFVIFLMYNTIENPDVKMIQELEVARDQANKANAAKTDFLSSMSHEIRTPLNAIVGFSDCINEATTLEEAKENAKDIVNASSTLLEIVNGILDISKIEAGKIEIVNSPYNAPDVFEELAKLITPKMKEKNLDFSYYIAPDMPKVLYGDHANIKKIVTNFLSNAYKYTDKGFVRYEVNCINTKDICKLVISIEDSGRGIKKENVDKMFTKFQRLDEDKNTTIEGTGLGLAITKQLVELMGGRIFVHTVYGQGSKFTVVLNQKIENVDAIEAVKKVKTTLDLNNVKILLVDDNTLNIKVATKLLERYNANRITSVDSGFECIERIKNGEKYDLILLDDMMPKMGGVETLHKLKELPDFSIPAIALTANAITGMKEKYLSEGFDNYLAKPIEKEQLVQVFNEVLGRSMTGEIPVPIESQSNSVISDNSQNEVIPVENIEKEIDINPNTHIQPEQLNNQDDIEQLEVSEDNKTGEEYLRESHVDLDKSLELLGDMQMYNETLKDYLNEVEEKWERINKYKEESDMANYAIEVHSLKSDSKYLGFMELADVAYEHELKSKENDIEFVNSNFNRLEEVYNKTLKIAKGYRE